MSEPDRVTRVILVNVITILEVIQRLLHSFLCFFREGFIDIFRTIGFVAAG